MGFIPEARMDAARRPWHRSQSTAQTPVLALGSFSVPHASVSSHSPDCLLHYEKCHLLSSPFPRFLTPNQKPSPMLPTGRQGQDAGGRAPTPPAIPTLPSQQGMLVSREIQQADGNPQRISHQNLGFPIPKTKAAPVSSGSQFSTVPK